MWGLKAPFEAFLVPFLNVWRYRAHTRWLFPNIHYAHHCALFSKKSGRVRSDQVTRAGTYLQKYLWLRQYYSFKGILMKLSGVDKGISAYKTIFSKFQCWWPELMQFCDPTILRQLENIQMHFILNVTVKTCYFSQDSLFLDYSRWPICSFTERNFLQVIRDHLMSS